MTASTLNDDVTMSGENATVLAGRYRIVRRLGQGGMGSVWLAEDLKLDGHKVAVKMLPSILVSNKRAYSQLKSEALVSLKLTHPNIATVRAFEENVGNPFLVMDYIDGLTLDEYLAKKNRLDAETTYALLEPVARALDYAHEKGVVHRDVKPGNVMVTWDGDPFVLDFGIAREIQETLTRVTGKLSSGTLLYMSPEQLKGAAPKPAQDVYSFAAMAYECLKGEPPFSRGQVEWQILNQAPEPLQGNALAPSIMRGLSKDPALRPPTCRGVLVVPRPRPRPSFGPAPASTGPAKPVNSMPVNKVSPPLDLRRILDQKGWLAAVLGGLAVVVALVAHWMADSDATAEPKRPIVSEAVPTDDPDATVNLVELDKTRIEAQVKVAACRRFDKGDGFGAKVEECENDLVRAKTEYELKRWGSAFRDYKAMLGKSVELISLDADRQRARAAMEKIGRQIRAVKEAEVCRYAEERFNAAKELVVQSRDAFAAMRFADAADKSELAARQFELAVDEAKREKLRLESLKKKLEVAREAAESARRSAEDQEAIRYANDKWNQAQSAFSLASSASDEGAVAQYEKAAGLYRNAEMEAAQNAKPTVYLTASLNGVPKNAEIVKGLEDKGRKTPVLVNIMEPFGDRCEFVVDYEESGRTYRGRAFCTSRKGRQTLDVPLERICGVSPKDSKSGERPAGDDLSALLEDLDNSTRTIDPGLDADGRPRVQVPLPKFCRHCGAKLADYSNVGTTCPACNGNLLGE